MNQQHDFGAQIKEQRGWIGLTQAELARRVACATITIRKIEANDLRPSAQIAERIAMALDVPLEERADFIRAARSISPDTPHTPIPPTPPPSSDEIGSEDLSGRAIRGYELADRIGTGGFGVVYRATQPLVEREVAVKIILPRLANDPKFIRRFEAEAQLVARLEHPHIVPLYDYWREPNAAYLVMRLLRGGNLRERMPEEDGGLPIDFILRVLEHIGAALYTAHRFGVIHRDLKPANILLDEDDNAYLADFGIAKNLVDPNSADLTQPGAITGSLAYASPEQLKTEPIKPQADIYALGILLYEMLCGRHPYHCNTPLDFYVKHTSEPLPSLSESDPDLALKLDPILERATAKDPLERYSDVPSFVAAFQDALAATPAVAPRVAKAIAIPPEAIENPYKGLRPFSEADQDDFFGQETLIQTLLGRLSEEANELARFLAVVGPSGSGKSSVVKAGVLPALRRGGVPGSENWFIVGMQPGTYPLEELEAVLLRVAVNPPESLLGQLQESKRGLLRAVRRILPEDPGVELLLVIDQFEEIFTLVPDEATRSHFLESLVTAVVDTRSRLRVVVTLRADFLDQPLRYVDFGELVRGQTEMVLPLTPDELEMAITAPARGAGLIFEPGLVSRIIREIGDQPGGLPLLQYTLTELFERREGNQLTNAAYEDFGGVLGALGHRAEEIYARLDDAGKEATRQLFLRLVTLGEGTEDTRRRVERSELYALQDFDQAQMDAAIDMFGRHRLLTFDRHPATRGPTVEVAHEAVLREWGRLRRWLDESRADLHMQRVLTNFAAEWVEMDRDPGMLLRGTRLSQFEEWIELTTVNLTVQEAEYLRDSLAARHQRELEEAERQQREAALEQRSRRFLRGLVGVFAGAALISIILLIIALGQRAAAQDNLHLAQENEATAIAAEGEALLQAENARESYAMSLAAHIQNALDEKDTNTALAMAMAAAGVSENPPAEVKRVLRQAAYAPGPVRRVQVTEVFEDIEGLIYALDVSPAENKALIGFDDGTLLYWRTDTLDEIFRVDGHSGIVREVIISPDGRTALSASDDGTIAHWNLDTGQEIYRFADHHGWVRTVAFSPDGKLAVSGGFVGDEAAGYVEADIVNPGELLLWEIESGEIIQRFEGHPSGVVDAIFSPDGKTILASSGTFIDIENEYSMFLWDVQTGEVIHDMSRPEELGDAFSLAINPDGRYAFAGHSITFTSIWDLQTGEMLSSSNNDHDLYVRMTGFSPDGSSLVSGDMDGKLTVHDFQSGELLLQAIVHGGGEAWSRGPMIDFDYEPAGHTAISGAGDGTLVFWDFKGALESRRLVGHQAYAVPMAFSPDDRYIFTGSGSVCLCGIPAEDNSIRMWDITTGEQIQQFIGHTDLVVSLDINKDGTRILSGALDGSLRFWDVASGQELLSTLAHSSGVFALALSPDSNRALSGSIGEGSFPDDGAILWDLSTGEMLYHYYNDNNATHLEFSPDGKTGYSPNAGVLRIMDIQTGKVTEKSLPVDWDIAFHPEDNTIFSFVVSDKIYISRIDFDTGEVLTEYGIHSGSRNMLALSPDAKKLLSSEMYDYLHLWDVESGEEIWRIDNGVLNLDVAMSNDGRLGASSGPNNSVILWDLTLPTELSQVLDWISSNRYVRELTCEERARYSIEPLCETERP